MKYAVLGAGAMGSTVASVLAGNGHEVCLWFTSRDEWLLPKVTASGRHPLSGASLQGVCAFGPAEVGKATDGCEAVVLASSSEGLLEVEDLLGSVGSARGAPRVVVTKGFLEAGEGVRTISETLAGREFALVGGPMVAGEIAAGKPAGGVIASSSERAIDAAAGLRSALLSLEVSPDVRGVELCSALKNVYAIMVGVAESRGANLRSLAFSRSLQELSALCGSLGGAPGTALGPAGSGDLYVTSISGRNGEFGRRVGSGEDPRELLRSMEGEGKTVEGVRAALLGSRYLDRRKQATPLILEGVARLCSGAAGPEELLGLLAG